MKFHEHLSRITRNSRAFRQPTRHEGRGSHALDHDNDFI